MSAVLNGSNDEWTKGFSLLSAEEIRAAANLHVIKKPIHFTPHIARRTKIRGKRLRDIVACPPHIDGLMVKAVIDQHSDTVLASLDRVRYRNPLYPGAVPMASCKVLWRKADLMKIGVTLYDNGKVIASATALVIFTTEEAY
jgi:hypothetical protein